MNLSVRCLLPGCVLIVSLAAASHPLCLAADARPSQPRQPANDGAALRENPEGRFWGEAENAKLFVSSVENAVRAPSTVEGRGAP